MLGAKRPLAAFPGRGWRKRISVSRQDRFGHILGALHAAVPGAAHWPRCSARIEEACATYGNILTVACEQTWEDVDIDLAPLHCRLLVVATALRPGRLKCIGLGVSAPHQI